jgi:hypothetical protein
MRSAHLFNLPHFVLCSSFARFGLVKRTFPAASHSCCASLTLVGKQVACVARRILHGIL